jgi:hypothetical protein
MRRGQSDRETPLSSPHPGQASKSLALVHEKMELNASQGTLA